MKNLYNKYLEMLGPIPSFLEKYLNVPSLVRLKNIGYFCGMDYASKDIYNFKEEISRFDHSLTVALLTYRYTHDEKATIAALFHDVATPCFAHVIDYMNKDYETQESTEEKQQEVIEYDQALINLLKEDNINPNDIIDFKKYSVVDCERPKLCADRIDGIILTSIAWTNSIDENMIYTIVNNIVVRSNEDNELELGFKDKDVALKVMQLNDLIDYECHTNYDNYMMELLANITRTAIESNLIKYEDLYYLKEDELFKIFENSNSKSILSLLDKFYHSKKEDIDNIEISGVKRRIIKPLVNGIRVD